MTCVTYLFDLPLVSRVVMYKGLLNLRLDKQLGLYIVALLSVTIHNIIHTVFLHPVPGLLHVHLWHYYKYIRIESVSVV